MLAIARFLTWTCSLEVLWAVFVGTTQSTELIAGLIAAVVTAVFVEVLRARRLLDFSPSLRVVAQAWSVPGHVVFDFFLVLWILVRELVHGRRVRGQWVEVAFPTEPGRVGRFQRALAATLENETANAIVVDLDDGKALLHSLDVTVKTGRSVL